MFLVHLGPVFRQSTNGLMAMRGQAAQGLRAYFGASRAFCGLDG
jgi:hypothetical protein